MKLFGEFEHQNPSSVQLVLDQINTSANFLRSLFQMWIVCERLVQGNTKVEFGCYRYVCLEKRTFPFYRGTVANDGWIKSGRA
jgi:hypothetical protein